MASATSAGLGHAGTVLDIVRDSIGRASRSCARRWRGGGSTISASGRLREKLEMLLRQLAGAKRGRTTAHGGGRGSRLRRASARPRADRGGNHPELGRHLNDRAARALHLSFRRDRCAGICELQELGLHSVVPHAASADRLGCPSDGGHITSQTRGQRAGAPPAARFSSSSSRGAVTLERAGVTGTAAGSLQSRR